ncbi:MAG: permease-like cell division protein FtsX [Candidatus Komeilibacteria bacterium]|nr:permease-like cell division protein FtsX [Candidatus Komeilibacteria bacterium]
MFILTLSRIVKFSLQNFLRNFWLAVVTITIIVLTLFSVTSLILVNSVMEQAIVLVKDKVDVSVYFKPTVSQEQIFLVQTNLQALNYVKDIKYVSKADALAKLHEQYQNSPLILEALRELQSNPLGDTLIVSTRETTDYQKVVDVLNTTPSYASLIDNKSFDDNRYIIEKLETLATQVRRGGWGITIFFALVAVLVIVNTIRIAIYTHRDEIAIMKLVGASNTFVRGPFLGEAILYAFVGTLITVILTYLVANFSNPYIAGLLGSNDFSLLNYLNVHFIIIFGLELLGMVIFSVLATAVALSRYLKV